MFCRTKFNAYRSLIVASAAVLAVGSGVLAKPADGVDFIARLTGAEEVPSRATPARGEALFSLNAEGTAIEYRLIVANIDNVVASHIHIAPAGTNGSVVAFLAGNFAPGGGRSSGVLATGTITESNLVGPLAGHPLSDLVEALEDGGAYVNVHTNDGVAPTNTGPGDFPGGEIRGQIHSVGN